MAARHRAGASAATPAMHINDFAMLERALQRIQDRIHPGRGWHGLIGNRIARADDGPATKRGQFLNARLVTLEWESGVIALACFHEIEDVRHAAIEQRAELF